MDDRIAMTLDEALALLDGDVEHDEHPSGRTCGVCGTPQQVWWSNDQLARHALYHRAQAVAAGAR